MGFPAPWLVALVLLCFVLAAIPARRLFLAGIRPAWLWAYVLLLVGLSVAVIAARRRGPLPRPVPRGPLRGAARRGAGHDRPGGSGGAGGPRKSLGPAPAGTSSRGRARTWGRTTRARAPDHGWQTCMPERSAWSRAISAWRMMAAPDWLSATQGEADRGSSDRHRDPGGAPPHDPALAHRGGARLAGRRCARRRTRRRTCPCPRRAARVRGLLFPDRQMARHVVLGPRGLHGLALARAHAALGGHRPLRVAPPRSAAVRGHGFTRAPARVPEPVRELLPVCRHRAPLRAPVPAPDLGHNSALVLVLLWIPKIVQEWVLHWEQLHPWQWLRETFFGVPPADG